LTFFICFNILLGFLNGLIFCSNNDESRETTNQKKDIKADIKDIEKTDEIIEDALDKNNDLPSDHPERVKALKDVENITEKKITRDDKEKAENDLLNEKNRLGTEREKLKGKLSDFEKSGNTTPTPSNPGTPSNSSTPTSDYIDDLPSDGPSFIDDFD
jgi:hypothetical protein